MAYPTLQEIKDRVVAQFKEHGFTATGEDGAPETMLAYAIAEEEYNAYNTLKAQHEAMNPLTAAGASLDDVGEFRGIERVAARVATDLTRTNVYFQLKAGASTPYTVPRGRLISAQNGARYRTVDSVTITKAGQVGRQYVGVRAIGVGARHNVEANQLTQHDDSNSDLIVNNILPIETGGSGQTDDEYRPEVLNYWDTHKQSVLPAIEKALREIPNVADLEITPMAYGIGTMRVFVESTNPITGAALIAEAQSIAESYAATGVRVFVEWPTHLFLRAELELSLSAGTVLSDVEVQAKEAVKNYINGLSRGETFIVQQALAAVVQINGIIDARFKTMERGIYDIPNQQVTYAQKINPSNQPAGDEEKWVTSLEELTTCEAN